MVIDDILLFSLSFPQVDFLFGVGGMCLQVRDQRAVHKLVAGQRKLGGVTA